MSECWSQVDWEFTRAGAMQKLQFARRSQFTTSPAAAAGVYWSAAGRNCWRATKTIVCVLLFRPRWVDSQVQLDDVHLTTPIWEASLHRRLSTWVFLQLHQLISGRDSAPILTSACYRSETRKNINVTLLSLISRFHNRLQYTSFMAVPNMFIHSIIFS